MQIPSADAIIQQKLKDIEKRIPFGFRIQYTTFDNILECQTEKSIKNENKISNLPSTTTAYDNLIEQNAAKYNVDSSLIKAIIYAESRFSPNDTSSKGAQGLMQLMPDTAKQLGVTDAYDPAQNIEGGTKFMAYLLDYYDGDVPLALAGYNAGPGNVKKYGGIPPFEETQNYIREVLRYQTKLKET